MNITIHATFILWLILLVGIVAISPVPKPWGKLLVWTCAMLLTVVLVLTGGLVLVR